MPAVCRVLYGVTLDKLWTGVVKAARGSRDETTDHSGDGDTGDGFSPGRSQGTEYADLDADGSQVGETAKSVLGNDPRAVREAVVATHERCKAQVGRELVGNQLGSEETRDLDDLSTRNAEEEGDGVENVPENQLERKVVNRETLSDPSEQTINSSNKGQDGQSVGEDEARNNEAEDGALREGVEGVGGRVGSVFAPVNDNAAAGHGLLGLGVAHF